MLALVILKVTSHTEVWIEIFDDLGGVYKLTKSPLIRRCGLKSSYDPKFNIYTQVTSHTEVWIEIICSLATFAAVSTCHLSYGGVD